MAIEVVPFVAAHLDAAAKLLAVRHRIDRDRMPELPAEFGEPTTARAAIESLYGATDADGWTALWDGQLAGFLIGKRQVFGEASIEALFLDTKAVSIPFTGYAARADAAETIYRTLYAAAADRWVAAGFLSHSISTTIDHAGGEPWFSLGFGRRFGHGIRALNASENRPEPPLPPTFSIRRAGPAARDAVFNVFAEGVRFHTVTPIFLPYLAKAVESHRAKIEGWLADPAVAIWVAESAGEVVGMVQMQPAEGHVDDGIRPANSVYLFEGHVNPGARGRGIGSALVERGLAWAREAGYAVCVVDWFTANPLSSSFWPRRGFVPFAAQLARRIDPRVSQSNG